MKKSLLKIISLLLIIAAGGLVLWLINKNFPATGQLEIEAVLGQDQPIISRLGPDPRLKLGNDYQIVLDSPVYFDLRSPRWFDQARIELIYKEGGRKLEYLAGRVGPEWQYNPQAATVITDLEDGWKKAVFDFDLNTLYEEKNVKRFLISTQGEIRQELYLKPIKVILKR
ncbi:MAG: hypothetical protein A2731_03830 [Candidatus Buchananbacteria bacterium RIFCSPHIGHO2_01_FULL_39_8]|uniref:Uncharacterized protein n=1 Tax=Candidatus Buchananbacteria bacterium RIFCSPHIGHO2_01_FULL_39_8 TaxID=1797533 RepID=A0A1G1XU79_9BACT|nr:MAG: hypothetical protein A2731_03830 [Candidatus Buchananbacteria bacterium RIFCSPHIGHO2_01_FULL_39_8]